MGGGSQEQVDKVEKQQKASFWLLDPRNVPAFSFSFSFFACLSMRGILCGKND